MKKQASINKLSNFTIMKLFKFFMVFSLITFLSLLAILIFPEPNYKNGFRDLQELQEYAKTIDEFIKAENKTFDSLCYENYYNKKFSSTFIKRITSRIAWCLSYLHITREPIFSPSFFKSLLTRVTTQRVQKGWLGDFIQKIEIKKTSKITVFGVTHGAFHSLIRDLVELKKLNIIDANLKIINPDYYITFLGSVVNRSAYTLETLSVLLKLLETNPENVIYLKGRDEFPDYWMQQTLKRELEIRARNLSKSEIPLGKEVLAFFNTLPITLFCSIPYLANQELPVFKISPYINNKELLRMLHDETSYQNFLLTPNTSKLEVFDLRNQPIKHEVKNENFAIKAIVTDIMKREHYQPMDGLRLLPPVKGCTAWTVLSAPSELYRTILNFYYDAFVVISPTNNFDEWLITLHNRDMRNINAQEFKQRSQNFFTGTVVNSIHS